MSSKKQNSVDDFEKLVDYSYALNPDSIKTSTRKKVNKILSYYGSENVKGFVWNANWSDNRNMEVPYGFSFAVREDTPIHHKIFSPNKMFQATCAFLIDPSKTKFSDGSSVNLNNIIQRVDRIEQGLKNSSLRDKFEEGTTLKTFESRMNNSQKSTPALGGSGSFVGLYMSDDRNGYKPIKQFWLLYQGYNQVASEELYRMMEEESHEKKRRSFNDFFYNNKDVRGIYSHIKANRKLVLQNVFDSIGLELKSKADISPTLETETNKVYHNVASKTIVYHAGTVDPSTQTGIIFNDNPHLGSSILRGQPENDKPFGSPWSATNNTFNAFPVNTGRKLNDSEVKQAQISSQENKVFTWSGNNDICWRLADNVYKRRDKEFKEIQYSIGYNVNWGEITLQPIMVRLSNSD